MVQISNFFANVVIRSAWWIEVYVKYSKKWKLYLEILYHKQNHLEMSADIHEVETFITRTPTSRCIYLVIGAENSWLYPVITTLKQLQYGWYLVEHLREQCFAFKNTNRSGGSSALESEWGWKMEIQSSYPLLKYLYRKWLSKYRYSLDRAWSYEEVV